MCGILGVVVKHPQTVFDNLKLIYNNQKKRGTVGCGIAVKRGSNVFRIRGRDSNHMFTSDKFTEPLKNLKKGDLVLLHHRFGTSGAPGDATYYGNHPISNENSTFFLIHNGVISNYKTLYNDLSKDHDFETEVKTVTKNGIILNKDITDSEVLVHLLEDGSIEKINQVSGSVAIAYMNLLDNNIFLYRDYNPISVYEDKQGNIYFSSEMPNNKKVFVNEVEVMSSTLYSLSSDGLTVLKELPKKVVEVKSYDWWYGWNKRQFQEELGW